MIDSLLSILWTTTWQTILLTFALGIILLLLGQRIEAKWRYLLWSVILVRFAVPVLPVTPWGIWNTDTTASNVHIEPIKHEDISAEFYKTKFNAYIAEPLPEMEHFSSEPMEIESNTPVTKFIAKNEKSNNFYVKDAKLTIFVIWIVGMCVFLVRLLWSEMKLFRCSRFWKETNDPILLELLTQCRKRVGVRRRVRLFLASGNIGAVSCGVLRPEIILCENAIERFSRDEIEMVLCHELTHIKRFDPLVQRLSLILCVFHWLNPCVWFVVSRLRRHRELACDSAVLHILGPRKRKVYGLTILAFAQRFSNHEPLPGLVGLFWKNNSQHELTRRIEMIIQFKKTSWHRMLTGVTLLLLFAAFGLTRAQSEQEQQVTEQKQIENQTEIQTVSHDTLEMARNLPESNDEERIQKIKSIKNFVYSLRNDPAKQEPIFKELIHLTDTVTDNGVKSWMKLEFAKYLAERDMWNLYMPLVESLGSPFREMEQAYRAALKDLENNNPESAKKRLLDFETQILKMPFGTEQFASGLFIINRLARIGFTEEAAEFIKKAMTPHNFLSILQVASPEMGLHIGFFQNSLMYTIHEAGFHLVSHGRNPDDKRKAFEFALTLCILGCGHPSEIMSAAIKEIVKEGNLDTALELIEKIEPAFEHSSQWETYWIIKALLEQNKYDKALELVRKTKSTHPLAQKQLYHDLMEYLLQKNENEKCVRLMEEALEKAGQMEKPQDRLLYLRLYAQIAKQLNDPKQSREIAYFARKTMDEISKDTSHDKLIHDRFEKNKGRNELAVTLYTLGLTNEAKLEFDLAIQEAKAVTDAWQKNGILDSVARAQNEIRLTEDAWKTIDLITDQSVKTEAYYDIASTALHVHKDVPGAKRALDKAFETFKGLNDSRIFGLILSLETEIKKYEQEHPDGVTIQEPKPNPELGKRAWEFLGFHFTVIPKDVYTKEYKEYMNEYPDGAIRITQVRPDSRIAECGIETGDVIFSIDDYVSCGEIQVSAIIDQLQKAAIRDKKDVRVMLSRPRPHDGLAANGYFFTEMAVR